MSMQYYARKPKEGSDVTCPYCNSNHTELFSLFGQQLLTTQYYCRACHTPFERIKDDDILLEVRKQSQSNPKGTQP